jgi:hypothetical protein
MADGIFNSITLTRQAEYKRTYDRLIERAEGRVKEKGVHENHHIVPRSLGGSNEKSNIVALTYKEHFLAHWLLTKFTTGKALLPMLIALWEMKRASKSNINRVISGWQYAIARRARSEATALWNKTPEGQEARRKARVTKLAFNLTPEGKEVLKNRGEKAGVTLRAFYATPEGQAVARKAGQKTGETAKSRGSKAGENHPKAKVTEETVRQIRAFVGTRKEVVAYFGVTDDIAYQILTGKTWTHVV